MSAKVITHKIDFDNTTKPTNLANSAVLRLLEEEEQAKRSGAKHHERYRSIDRETVLKINRGHRRIRDSSWPPLLLNKINNNNKIENDKLMKKLNKNENNKIKLINDNKNTLSKSKSYEHLNEINKKPPPNPDYNNKKFILNDMKLKKKLKNKNKQRNVSDKFGNTLILIYEI